MGATASNAAITRPANNLAATDITYDAHGNVTKLGDQTFVYDSSDRHTKTTLTDGTVIDYVRDVAGNIVARTQTPPGGPAATVRYSRSLILDTSNAVVQRNLGLPGGVTVSLPTSGAAKWAYPNLHGDITWTADTAGTRTGFYLYDPFGQPIDLTTTIIGSAVSDEAVPDLQPGDYDLGWVGSKGKGYEHAGSIATIEMGVRMYVPFLGRFLSSDPVAGGNTAWYNYPNDPVNKFDLSEALSPDAIDRWSKKGYKFTSLNGPAVLQRTIYGGPTSSFDKIEVHVVGNVPKISITTKTCTGTTGLGSENPFAYLRPTTPIWSEIAMATGSDSPSLREQFQCQTTSPGITTRRSTNWGHVGSRTLRNRTQIGCRRFQKACSNQGTQSASAKVEVPFMPANSFLRPPATD